jgi:hypothetical protein
LCVDLAANTKRLPKILKFYPNPTVVGNKTRYTYTKTNTHIHAYKEGGHIWANVLFYCRIYDIHIHREGVLPATSLAHNKVEPEFSLYIRMLYVIRMS